MSDGDDDDNKDNKDDNKDEGIGVVKDMISTEFREEDTGEEEGKRGEGWEGVGYISGEESVFSLSVTKRKKA